MKDYFCDIENNYHKFVNLCAFNLKNKNSDIIKDVEKVEKMYKEMKNICNISKEEKDRITIEADHSAYIKKHLNITKRPSWEEYFMLQAHLIATRSTCDRGPPLLFFHGRHGTGTVLVRNNRIISSGYNGSTSGMSHCDEIGHLLRDGHCVRTIHSERNAIDQCAWDGISTKDSVLYTTTLPCWDCTKDIINCGIKKVFYSEDYDSRYELSGTVIEEFKKSGIEIEQLDISYLFQEEK